MGTPHYSATNTTLASTHGGSRGGGRGSRAMGMVAVAVAGVDVLVVEWR